MKPTTPHQPGAWSWMKKGQSQATGSVLGAVLVERQEGRQPIKNPLHRVSLREPSSELNQALHSTTPWYLSEELCYVADMPARGCLRSSTSSLLDVRPSRRATVAGRSFATTVCPTIWNGLPEDVTSATSLLTFRQKLKAHLFQQSYQDIIL